MFTYRLTKYDLGRRRPDGAFITDDWTSVSDIGQEFAGRTLTREHYQEIEDAYVQTLLALLQGSGVDSMSVSDLERREGAIVNDLGDDVLAQCSGVRDGLLLAREALEPVFRGCLREYIWCRLFGPFGTYVHFGYDYYTYVGLSRRPESSVVAAGLFLESFESPYLVLDD